MIDPAAVPPLPLAPEPTPEHVRAGVRMPPIKDQVDLNIEVYKNVFRKCLIAAEALVIDDIECGPGAERRSMTVDVAKAIFDRFYSDQAALSSGKLQAKAMIDGMTSVLEGRR